MCRRLEAVGQKAGDGCIPRNVFTRRILGERSATLPPRHRSTHRGAYERNLVFVFSMTSTATVTGLLANCFRPSAHIRYPRRAVAGRKSEGVAGGSARSLRTGAVKPAAPAVRCQASRSSRRRGAIQVFNTPPVSYNHTHERTHACSTFRGRRQEPTPIFRRACPSATNV